MEHILVLDPATSCGYCIANYDKEKDTATIFEEGFFDVDTSSNYQGDHCINLMDQIESLINKIMPCTHIVIEDFFFNKKYRNGSTVNAAFRTAIHILARKKDIPYTIININAWKTFIAGRSTPTREQKKQWGKFANKLFIQDALWKKYNFKFPNHSMSVKGRPIKFRTDIVDVVAQTIYFIRMILDIRNIIRNIEVSPDVEFKRTLKGTYVYS